MDASSNPGYFTSYPAPSLCTQKEGEEDDPSAWAPETTGKIWKKFLALVFDLARPDVYDLLNGRPLLVSVTLPFK